MIIIIIFIVIVIDINVFSWAFWYWNSIGMVLRIGVDLDEGCRADGIIRTDWTLLIR